MRVLVTRPGPQAVEWVESLRAHGIDAHALPLIGIEPAADRGAVRAAWGGLADLKLVVFVSPNAAQQFIAERPPAFGWPAHVRAGSPGPGTTRTLIELGIPPQCIVEPAADAAQFDSETLWAQLAMYDWRGADVLVVRGDSGRDWLADQLRAQGARVVFVQAYQRTAPRLDATARNLLHDAATLPSQHLWLFSSSQAIDNLAAIALPAPDWAQARAIATHPRIAERARRLGFASVTAARPALDAVVACIQSIRP